MSWCYMGKTPFRYYKMWREALDIERLVIESWQTDIHGSLTGKVVQRLKNVKQVSKGLNRNEFNNI